MDLIWPARTHDRFKVQSVLDGSSESMMRRMLSLFVRAFILMHVIAVHGLTELSSHAETSITMLENYFQRLPTDLIRRIHWSGN